VASGVGDVGAINKNSTFPAAAPPAKLPEMSEPPLAVFLAPLFLVFEITQLVYVERFIGVKQIQAGVDPRELGPSEPVAALWTFALCTQSAWLLWLLSEPPTRLHAACMLLVWLVGFSIRSNCRLKWVLVVLTVEGALRMGLMVSMFGSAWRAL
jgi:hypothetical protein